MLSVIRTVLLITTAAVAIGPSGILQGPATEGRPAYTEHQKEYYLTAEQESYIRPGFKIGVESVTFTADNKVEVVVNFKDDKNQPLDRLGNVTPGALSVSFILGWYDGDLRQYTTYTTRTQTSPITGVSAVQSSADSGGTWTDLELGRAKYAFKTVLPSGYDGSKTHTLAAYGSRNLTDIIGKSYYANTEHDFRPDGGAVTETWNAFTEATCNACHHDLGLHGGSRKHIKNCVTCHQPQTMDPDTGNTVDFKVMIHKIHMGANLPSVQAGTPYVIIGNRQSVHDYSGILLPQDIRNCDSCHKTDSPEGDIWLTRPTQAACGSCHDDVDFATGENHAAGPAADDSACASCHAPEGEFEFDASIKGAHTIEVKSAQLKGLNIEILDATGFVPGGMPTIQFRVTEDDGTFVAPSTLNSMRLLIGGPTTDYDDYFRADAKGAAVSSDVATFTFTTTLPEDAAGTWAVSADVYRNVTIDNGTETGFTLRECAYNPIHYVEVGAARAAMPRREVVSEAKCNVCHDRLALHGGQRFAIAECVICHMPNEDDSAVRPEDAGAPESVHFKWLIHRLHTGHELTNDFTVYGYQGSVHNYNHVGYPGDRRICEACHNAGTYDVPVPEGLLPTPTPRDYYSPMMPEAAACLSCHSSREAAAHAYTMTAPFGEACAACHGNSMEFSVAAVHAR